MGGKMATSARQKDRMAHDLYEDRSFETFLVALLAGLMIGLLLGPFIMPKILPSLFCIPCG